MSATNGVNGVGKSNDVMWKLGLLNVQTKYLTAEAFGFKINASGSSLRKKQTWTLEIDTAEEEVVYLKSHLGRYIAGDKKGNVTCSHETRDPETQFTIEYQKDGSGKWAFKNKVTGYYFGGSEDNLRCYEKSPTLSDWWIVRLAVHPQVNILNVNRKKYGHLENNEIHFNELIPWGQDSLLTIEYQDGRYAVRTCDKQYLSRDGSLQSEASKDCLFTLEIKSGQFSGMALKDCVNKYLTAVGTTGTMQSRDKPTKQDIVFTLEDSHPQAFITAHNGKKVSIKQGIDLAANQDEVADQETFQIELDKKSGSSKWRLRTAENKFWSLEQASGIQNTSNATRDTGLFEFEYQDDGRVAIKANNGRYVTAKLNGSLYAIADSPSDKEIFTLTIVNRPLLVLRCEFGFVGFKTANNPRVECNRSTYDTMFVEHSDGASSAYYLKGANGRYWAVDDEGMINADSGEAHPFYFELSSLSRFRVKAPNGLSL